MFGNTVFASYSLLQKCIFTIFHFSKSEYSLPVITFCLRHSAK